MGASTGCPAMPRQRPNAARADQKPLPASPGTGLIAGNTIRAVLEAAGVRDIVATSLGSSNHANVVKATLQALASLRTSDQVLADRGKKKEKAI